MGRRLREGVWRPRRLDELQDTIQESELNQLKDIANALKQQMKELHASEGHLKIETAEQTIIVLSVYDGQRTSYDILNDLWDWAEQNQNVELLDKITALAELK